MKLGRFSSAGFPALLCYFSERRGKNSWSEPNWSQLEPVGPSLGRRAALTDTPQDELGMFYRRTGIHARASLSVTPSVGGSDGRSCQRPSTVTAQKERREREKQTMRTNKQTKTGRCLINFYPSVFNFGADGNNFWKMDKTRAQPAGGANTKQFLLFQQG